MQNIGFWQNALSEIPPQISKRIVECDDTIIETAMVAYHFLFLKPSEQNNAQQASIIINFILRKKGIFPDYYIPLARFFQKEAVTYLISIKDSSNEAYSKWLLYFLNALEKTLANVQEIILTTKRLNEAACLSIQTEKTNKLLLSILSYMEKYPVFDINDIIQEFHVAYNTASKAVSLLEKQKLVSEITQKQRYRIYCYDKYFHILQNM